MKYSKVYEKDGVFYVMIGSKKYMPHTASESRERALEHCNVESIKFHLEEARKLMRGNMRLLERDQFLWGDVGNSVAHVKDMVEDSQRAHENYDMNDPCTWA